MSAEVAPKPNASRTPSRSAARFASSNLATSSGSDTKALTVRMWPSASVANELASPHAASIMRVSFFDQLPYRSHRYMIGPTVTNASSESWYDVT